jgi:predicted nucleotide-binding protein
VPRDNLIFELGLFTGTLGRAKTFLVKCRDEDIELPSDLLGVTTVEYGMRTDGNFMAAISPVCLRIKEVMGVR